MFYETADLVLAKSQLQALLAALSARPAAALWVTPNVHLFVNSIQPTAESALGDFTEATFVGYAAAPLPTLSAPVHLANDSQAVLANIVFIAGAVVPPGQTVHGYFITDTTNAIFYAAEAFATPIPISNAGDFIDLDFVVPEPAQRLTA